MAIRHYETEEELDDSADEIEEINERYGRMKEDIDSKYNEIEELEGALQCLKVELQDDEKELMDFREENSEYLI